MKHINRRQTRNYALLLVLFVISVGACGVKKAPTPAKKPLKLTILHSGQVYGEILPCG